MNRMTWIAAAVAACAASISPSQAFTDADLDRLAAENLAGDIISGSLCTLSAYLEANVARHTGVENCVPIVTQAAHRFAGRDYAEAFNLIWLAYRTIETIRITDPQLPPLRRSGQVPPDQTSSSIH